jgi:selenocysteine-specific elongation factor
MRRLILGTAGHIDHGKTALVKALTGVDTDRLKEEKERGITVDLGFAEYPVEEELSFGVVDVPGHEGFIRNMVAGASGMDLVLLVVAADEGVMPQTREHLSIVGLLGVPRVAVAVTKADLVEEEWLELVEEEVRELLEPTAFRDAPILPVSAITGEGLPELGQLLGRLAQDTHARGADDVVRLPVDRVFTVRGAGTVVTGSLWSGTLAMGHRVRLLPGDQEARVRSLQIHGEEVEEAPAGSRLAVGLSGPKVSHQDLTRGQALVSPTGWEVSWMLTSRITHLPGSGWEIEQGQRVRVHLGTAEVLARVALLDRELLRGGEEAWVQLRLESPVLARVRDHLVVRSYSPLTTIGGGPVAEVLPRKRRRLSPGEADLLAARLGSDDSASVSALATLARWSGVPVSDLSQRTGLSPSRTESAVESLRGREDLFLVDDLLFSREIRREGEGRILRALEAFHTQNPLKPGIPLEELRQVIPGDFGPRLAEALLRELSDRDEIHLRMGHGMLAGFRRILSRQQEALRGQLRTALGEGGLTPPPLKELAHRLGDPGEIEGILRLMEDEGEVVGLDGEFFLPIEAVRRAGEDVVRLLGGARNLGPADFKEALPMTRRHLLPLLRYFDLVGVTTRMGDGRDVAHGLPEDWGG